MDERTNLYGESTGVRHEAKDGKNNKSGKQGGDLIDKNIRMIVKNYVMKDLINQAIKNVYLNE